MCKTVIYFILISLMFSSSAFSQKRKANFLINNNKYSIPKDDEMDIIFVNIFKELVNNGEAKNYDRELWFDSYYRFINLADRGTYNIESVADYITSMSYSGNASKEDLGMDSKGSQKRFSRRNYVKYPYMRMARLSQLICKKVLMIYRENK